MATSMQVDIAKDKKHVHSNMIFYGVLKRIWMLDYYNFNILVFKCDWVDNKNSIKVDELGFTYVELSKVGHKSDSFILTLQAKKVLRTRPIESEMAYCSLNSSNKVPR